MNKYAGLGKYLSAQKNAAIPMTFSEIEEAVGCPLPASARYPAWWSNNTSNNVMTKVWLSAGYKTEQVDIGGRKLVFRKTTPAASGVAEAPRPFRTGHPLRGALKGIIRIVLSTDLTKPADSNWDES